jgi:SAM-dependent methyltransferase
MFWWRGLLPRVHRHLPAGRVLEIGPGFGRWTSHLVSSSQHLTVVDLTERCIEHCRNRFADRTNIEYWTNDGQSLDMVADESLDFVFSFDSLVHAEAHVLREYVLQLGRKLRPGGTGFIHHSNLHALADSSGAIPSWVTRKNWRGESMSARLFREFCREAGLHCVSQEIVNWISRSRKADRHAIPGPGMPLTDAFSTFARPSGAPQRPTKIYVNQFFAEEWRQCTTLASVYGEAAFASRVPPPPPGAPTAGVPTLLQRVRARAARVSEHVSSLARELRTARQVRRREPILNALQRGTCPDCARPLTSGHLCSPCSALFEFRR